MRKEISKLLVNAAAEIGLAPGKLFLKTFPDNGPGGPGYAFVILVVSGVVTLPLTIPIGIAAKLIEPKEGK